MLEGPYWQIDATMRYEERDDNEAIRRQEHR